MNFKFIRSITSLSINSCFRLVPLPLTINFTHEFTRSTKLWAFSAPSWHGDRRHIIWSYPNTLLFFIIVAFNHDFCSLFWSKQVTDTQSGMVSTPKIVMRRGVDYARLCETMRQDQKICTARKHVRGTFLCAACASACAKLCADSSAFIYGFLCTGVTGPFAHEKRRLV